MLIEGNFQAHKVISSIYQVMAFPTQLSAELIFNYKHLRVCLCEHHTTVFQMFSMGKIISE